MLCENKLVAHLHFHDMKLHCMNLHCHGNNKNNEDWIICTLLLWLIAYFVRELLKTGSMCDYLIIVDVWIDNPFDIYDNTVNVFPEFRLSL